MISPSSIFVIVPAYNEATVIRETVGGLLEKNYSVVVVDDSSSDDTKRALSGLSVFYIRHLANLGQGAALRTGIEYALQAGAQYLVTFDADGQHDPVDIDRMLNLLQERKGGIVFGSRFIDGSSSNIPLPRRIILRFARFINYLVSGILLTDANNGLRIMTREAAIRMQITENRSTHSAQIQNLVKINDIVYSECPVNIYYSAYSKQKGIKNISSVRILYELIMFKLFR